MKIEIERVVRFLRFVQLFNGIFTLRILYTFALSYHITMAETKELDNLPW